MKLKILHVVGGSSINGSFKGACILHKALEKLNVNSCILNDTADYNDQLKLENSIKNIKFINKKFINKIMGKFFIICEKIFKSILLHSPRETFTFGILGFDITKTNEYREADIIHIHWISQGFVSLKSLGKINKPTVWTMRDMWAFTGGAHYEIDFKKYENSFVSKIIKNYKFKQYNKSFYFVAVSNWLRDKAKESLILKNKNVYQIDNNVEIENFEIINKDAARSFLGIKTTKQILLYGAQNPQSLRKGWKRFLETLKLVDKSKYYLLIFGNFWSHEDLNKIGIEYKSLGFISNSKTLNQVYSSADIFVASSLEDAWPKTFAEAMYCGIPVVCFNNTSISEIVNHKLNGYVVDDLNPLSLKNGIDWLSDQVKNNKLDNLKIQNKILNYDPSKIATKYIDFYKKIIKL